MSSAARIEEARHRDLDRDLSAHADHLMECLATGRDDAVSDETLKKAFASLVEIYARKAEGRQEIFPLEPAGGVNATAVLMTTTALLKGANLELFELGMWQSWSGMK